jgi:SAM-dependent methyltransferase
MLWTKVVHRGEVHQTTPFTAEDRYPALFDLAARLVSNAERILSFGCSTGEELMSIRRRFPSAAIIGVEINPRSRRLAAQRIAADAGLAVVPPQLVTGLFDLVFALAVLQREPHKIDELNAQNIAAHYPFARFDAAVRDLDRWLRPGGLLCVTNTQYRIEDSSIASNFEPVAASPLMDGPLFASDGERLHAAVANTIFRKRG